MDSREPTDTGVALLSALDLSVQAASSLAVSATKKAVEAVTPLAVSGDKNATVAIDTEFRRTVGAMDKVKVGKAAIDVLAPVAREAVTGSWLEYLVAFNVPNWALKLITPSPDDSLMFINRFCSNCLLSREAKEKIRDEIREEEAWLSSCFREMQDEYFFSHHPEITPDIIRQKIENLKSSLNPREIDEITDELVRELSPLASEEAPAEDMSAAKPR